MSERAGVLVMAYGTPAGLGDVERYYTHIRHGAPPARNLLEELTERYRAIGGSPLFELTVAQQRGLEARLGGVKTYLGLKHSAPFIADGVKGMVADGVTKVVGLVLAPHYSSMSVGDYARRVEEAAEDAGFTGTIDVIRSWHLEPGYVSWLAQRVVEARDMLPEEARSEAVVIFSAHSLPARILEAGDEYADQLAATAKAAAELAHLDRFEVGWQSAGRTAEPWIGPDLVEMVKELAAAGVRGVVVCPCGFVADHLEVLYDVDIEAAEAAAELGVNMVRTHSPNDDPVFLDMLAGVVRQAL